MASSGASAPGSPGAASSRVASGGGGGDGVEIAAVESGGRLGRRRRRRRRPWGRRASISLSTQNAAFPLFSYLIYRLCLVTFKFPIFSSYQMFGHMYKVLNVDPIT